MEAPIKLGMWAYMRGGDGKESQLPCKFIFLFIFFYSRMKETQANQGGRQDLVYGTESIMFDIYMHKPKPNKLSYGLILMYSRV